MKTKFLLSDDEHCYGVWNDRSSLEASLDHTMERWTYLENGSVQVTHEGTTSVLFIQEATEWQAGEAFL